MTEFIFCWYSEYEDGKMARLETKASGIPVNIYAEDNSNFSIFKNQKCKVDVIAIGSDIQFYENENEFIKAYSNLSPISMIPSGTFPADPDDKDFKESPHIIFTGRILEAEMNPEAKEDEPNCYAVVEILEMTITVFFRTDHSVSSGGILDGIAWLYGDILNFEDEV